MSASGFRHFPLSTEAELYGIPDILIQQDRNSAPGLKQAILKDGRLKRAMQKLHLSIDYHSIDTRPGGTLSKETLLADGLAYTYRLSKSKGANLERTRSFGTEVVVKRLRELIPGPHLVTAGVPASGLPLVPKGGFTPSHLQLLEATATYIAELVVTNTNSQLQESQHDKTESTSPTQQGQCEAITKTERETMAASDKQEEALSAVGQKMEEANTETLIEKSLAQD